MSSSLWCTLSIFLLALWIGVIPTSSAAGNGSPDDLSKLWDQVSTSYPKYENTTKLLEELKAMNPDLVKVYSVGKSVENREMWVINLRANIQQERKLLQPPMKIVANMHGDETVGRSLMLMLAVDLVKKFRANDPR